MKKLFGTMAVAAALFTGYNAYNANINNELTDIALANVEALAEDESDDDKTTTWQKGEKTITTEVYKTEESGWSWDVSLKVWLLNGSVTKTSPKNYTKTTEQVKIYCCRLGGDLNVCNYEAC